MNGPGMARHFCLDIGGTYIKLASGDDTGLGKADMVATPTGRAAFMERTVDLVVSAGIAPQDRLGVSIAGSIDSGSGSVDAAQLPQLAGTDFASELARQVGKRIGAALQHRVSVENDANCFALAEAHFGAGRGFDNVFAIILGTGVGGGQVCRGDLVRGFGGTQGEWGHGPFVQKQDPLSDGYIPQFTCGCGLTGCIDTVGGARGMESIHAAAGNARIDSKAIVAGWLDGEKSRGATISSYVGVLSDALAIAANITGAEIIPVGGGLSNAEELLTAIDGEVQRKVLKQRPGRLVVKGQTGHNGGLWGMHARLMREGQAGEESRH